MEELDHLNDSSLQCVQSLGMSQSLNADLAFSSLRDCIFPLANHVLRYSLASPRCTLT